MKKLDHRFNSSLVISNLKRDRRTHFKKDKDGSHRTPSPTELKNTYPQKQQILSSEVKKKLEGLISQMLEKVQETVTKEKNSLRLAMNYVRSSVIFKQIDEIDSRIVEQIVGEYVNTKLEAMQEILNAKSRQLEELRQEIKYQRQFSEIKLNLNSVHLSPHEDNVMLLLYSKAKTSSLQQFKQIYNEVSIQKTTRFSNSKCQNQQPGRQSTLKNNHYKKITELDVKQLIEELQPYLTYLPLECRERLLKALEQKTVCVNPCCRWDQNDFEDVRQFKLHAKPRLPTSNRSNSFYTTSDFLKFHERYLNKNFKVNQVVSMTRTRTQQMDRFYSVFKRKQKLKKREQERNKSLA